MQFTVTVNDGKGGTASATTSRSRSSRRRAKEFTFEDVHFDFDRFTLRPDALKVLDEAVTAMQANPTLRLTIEGHTCNIGTTEYNLALGERRAHGRARLPDQPRHRGSRLHDRQLRRGTAEARQLDAKRRAG